MTADTLLDFFSIYIAGVGEALSAYCFFGRLVRRKGSPGEYAVFAFLCCITGFTGVSGVLEAAVWVMLLFLCGYYFKSAGAIPSAISAVTVIGIMQSCFGLCGIITGYAAIYAPRSAFAGIAVMLSGEILSLLLSGLCLGFMGRRFSFSDNDGCSAALFCIPCALAALSGEYINHSLLGNTVSLGESSPAPNFHIMILLAAGIACFLSAASTSQRLSASAALNRHNELLSRYVKCARMSLDSTRSFRHDIKNHLTVLGGLLGSDNIREAREYLEALGSISAGLSPKFSTGNAAADILLAEKLDSPCCDEISVCCSLHIPECDVNDTDICTILSNAIDNAVKGCGKFHGDKFISVDSRHQGNLLLIIIKNSFDGNADFKKGTGLRNIERTARKYGGTAHISSEKNVFTLTVLLNISQQQNVISRHSY